MKRPLIWLFLMGLLYMKPSLASCFDYRLLQEHVHVVKVNLKCDGLGLVSTKEVDRGQTVSMFAKKYVTDVAINGSYFRTDFQPFGLTVSDGQIWSKARDLKTRVFFACTQKNDCLIESANQITSPKPEWKIVISGWQVFDASKKKFICSDLDERRCMGVKFVTKQPRTALGLDENNHLYIIVAEGRLKSFKGLTLDELANVLVKLNVKKAVNLDGGGSSTLVINQKRVSMLPEKQKQERVVANHFGIIVTHSSVNH